MSFFRRVLFLFLMSFIQMFFDGNAFCEITSNTSVKTNDTIKITKILEDGNRLKKSDPYKSMELANQAMSLSLARSYKKGLMNSLILYGVLYKNKGKYEYSAKCYFGALKIAEEKNDLENISKCLNNIGSVYQSLIQNH